MLKRLCAVGYAQVYQKESSIIYLGHIPANTKPLFNICTTSAPRLRRWSNDVQVLYKCFMFNWMLVAILPQSVKNDVMPRSHTQSYPISA